MSERIILTDLDEQMQEAVADTRQRVAKLHAELPRWGLVVWTAGNVSERVTLTRNGETITTDLFVIKPSGVSYDELRADTMVVCTLKGDKIDDGTPASLTPSSDTAAHAYVYRHMDRVGGIVHTHSTYATASWISASSSDRTIWSGEVCVWGNSGTVLSFSLLISVRVVVVTPARAAGLAGTPHCAGSGAAEHPPR